MKKLIIQSGTANYEIRMTRGEVINLVVFGEGVELFNKDYDYLPIEKFKSKIVKVLNWNYPSSTLTRFYNLVME